MLKGIPNIISPELLEAILKLFPLDTYQDPVYIMEKVPGDDVPTPILDTYRQIIKPHTDADLTPVERFEFYERAKKAYAVVMTGEINTIASPAIRYPVSHWV